MQLSLDPNKGHYYITAYTPGEIIINDRYIGESLIVTANQLIHPWRPQSFADLKCDDLAAFEDLQPELVLLGTGAVHRFPDPLILAFFYEKGIGIESMNTHAACRTFNVLVAEGRKVAAGLILS